MALGEIQPLERLPVDVDARRNELGPQLRAVEVDPGAERADLHGAGVGHQIAGAAGGAHADRGRRDGPDRRVAVERDGQRGDLRFQPRGRSPRHDGETQLQRSARHSSAQLEVGDAAEVGQHRGERVGRVGWVGAEQAGEVREPHLQVGRVAGDRGQPVARRGGVGEQPVDGQRRELLVEPERAEQVIGDRTGGVAERLADQRLDRAHEVAPEVLGGDLERLRPATDVDTLERQAQRRMALEVDRRAHAQRVDGRGGVELEVERDLERAVGRPGDGAQVVASGVDQRQPQARVHLQVGRDRRRQGGGDPHDLARDGHVDVAAAGRVEQRVPRAPAGRSALVRAEDLVEQLAQRRALRRVGEHAADAGQRVLEPRRVHVAVGVEQPDGAQQRADAGVDRDREAHTPARPIAAA